jgi:hypothetical protein
MNTNIAITAAALLFVPGLALADDTIPEKRPTNIVVHVATDGAVLRSQNGFEIACTAPCDSAVPADQEYRLSTHGVASVPFTLNRDVHAVRLSMEGGANTRGPGIALTVLGGIASVVGGSLLAFGAMDHSNDGAIVAASQGILFVTPTTTQPGQYRDVIIAGGVTLGVGLAALVSGLVLFAATKKPQVIQTAIRF